MNFFSRRRWSQGNVEAVKVQGGGADLLFTGLATLDTQGKECRIGRCDLSSSNGDTKQNWNQKVVTAGKHRHV